MKNPTRIAQAVALKAGPNGPVIIGKADAEFAPELIATARAEGVPVLSAPPLAEALVRGETLPGPLVETLLAILALAERLAPPAEAPTAPPDHHPRPDQDDIN